MDSLSSHGVASSPVNPPVASGAQKVDASLTDIAKAIDSVSIQDQENVKYYREKLRTCEEDLKKIKDLLDSPREELFKKAPTLYSRSFDTMAQGASQQLMIPVSLCTLAGGIASTAIATSIGMSFGLAGLVGLAVSALGSAKLLKGLYSKFILPSRTEKHMKAQLSREMDDLERRAGFARKSLKAAEEKAAKKLPQNNPQDAGPAQILDDSEEYVIVDGIRLHKRNLPR